MMNFGNDKQAVVRSVLESEVECVRELLRSLDAEYDALAEKQTTELEEIVRKKQETILQLESISRQREELFASIEGLSVDGNDGKKHYQFNGNKQLITLWNELVDVAELCRNKNRINGGIVDLVTRQSRQALDLLHGIAPDTASTSSIYDHSGQTRHYPNKRTLIHV